MKVKVSKMVSYTATVKIGDSEVQLPISQQPASIMDFKKPFLAVSEDGAKLVLGYLVDDSDCESPLENDEGSGNIYTRRRHAPREELAGFRKAFGIDENGDKIGDSDPLAVPLDIYEHGGISYSVSGEGMQDRFDTARCGAVWVPNDCARGNLRASAQHELPKTATEQDILSKMAELAVEYARGVVKEYTDWCNGNNFGQVIETFECVNGEWALLDTESCYGFIGDDYAHENMMSEAQARADHLFGKIAAPQG